MFTIDDTMVLPAPRGLNANQRDTCPTCYANTRNFGALFLVVAGLEGGDSIHMLLTPQGRMLVQATKGDSTSISSDEVSTTAENWRYYHSMLEDCRTRANETMHVTSLPSAVAQRVQQALGNQVPSSVTIHCFTEDALRPAT